MPFDFNYYLSRLEFTKTKQCAFLQDLCTLVGDGVPAPQAVGVIHKVASGAPRAVARSILIAIAKGQRISDGMEGWFPQHIVAIIRNGEEGGSFTEMMSVAAKSLEEHISVTSSLIGSVTYPLIVFAMACIVAVFLRHYIFSTFETIKPMSEWPPSGRAFITLATFIQFWWWLVILIAGSLVLVVMQFLRNFVGDARKVIDSVPPFSLYRAVVASRFMEVLGLLIAGGISFKDALTTMQRRTTRYMAWHIYMMEFRLSGGRENLADVLDTGLLSSSDIERLRVTAQSRSFEHALVQLGNQAARQNVKALRAIGKFLGGMILIIDASLAIFIITSIYNVGMAIGALQY